MLSLVEITAFRLESNFPPTRALEFVRDCVTFKLPYDFSYQMKTPLCRLVLRYKTISIICRSRNNIILCPLSIGYITFDNLKNDPTPSPWLMHFLGLAKIRSLLHNQHSNLSNIKADS